MPCRIVLLHATPVAMAPIQEAFAERWPEAEIVNLLDDGLSIDRAREADLSERMIDRFVDFGRYGHRMGADGILVTCSAFGPAIEQHGRHPADPRAEAERSDVSGSDCPGWPHRHARHLRPRYRHDDGRIRRVRAAQRKARHAQDACWWPTPSPRCAVAMPRPTTGWWPRRAQLEDQDVIMLAHFSTSRAAQRRPRPVGMPVLTAPHAAVDSMRAMIGA
jgi:hypothetical protein